MERMDNQNSNLKEGLASHNHETNGGSTNQNRGTFGGIQTRFSLVYFPQFNGEDPTEWIYKAEKCFRYQRMADNEKVLLISFNLQDEALQWYQWFEKARRDVSWEEFTLALCIWFEPSDYEDFMRL